MPCGVGWGEVVCGVVWCGVRWGGVGCGVVWFVRRGWLTDCLQ